MGTLAAILAGLGLASSVAGGLIGGKKNKESEKRLESQEAEARAKQYESALDSAGTRAYLNAIDRRNEKNNLGLDNGVISTGATVENTLAQKQAASDAVQDAVANALVKDETNKYRYFTQANELSNKLAENRANQATNWVNMASGIANSMKDLGMTYLDNPQKGIITNGVAKGVVDPNIDEE